MVLPSSFTWKFFYNLKIILFIIIAYVCRMWGCYSACVDIKGQLLTISPLLLPRAPENELRLSAFVASALLVKCLAQALFANSVSLALISSLQAKRRIKHDVPILWMGIIETIHLAQHPSAESFELLYMMNGFPSKRAMWWKWGLDSKVFKIWEP